MRKNITLLALAIVSMATLFSCSKSSSGSSSSSTATVNGKSFSSGNCIFFNTGGALSVTAYTGATGGFPALVLGVTSFSTTGTYTIDGYTVSAGIDSSASSAVAATSGTITITTATASNVAGTYSFTCPDGTTVTGGSFSAKVP